MSDTSNHCDAVKWWSDAFLLSVYTVAPGSREQASAPIHGALLGPFHDLVPLRLACWELLRDVEAEASVTFGTVSFGRVVSGIRMKDTYDISAHHCISAHHYDDMI